MSSKYVSKNGKRIFVSDLLLRRCADQLGGHNAQPHGPAIQSIKIAQAPSRQSGPIWDPRVPGIVSR